MKRIFLSFINLFIFSNLLFSQAKINNNNNVIVYEQVGGNGFTGYSGNRSKTYTMSNFIKNDKYKIDVVKEGPDLAKNLTIAAGNVVVGTGYEFSHNGNNNFNISYWLPLSTAKSQTQLIKCQIFKRRLLIFWDWQTTFFYYISTTCMESDNIPTNYTSSNPYFPNPLPSGKYEVVNTLTVSCPVNPSTGKSVFDAGKSVLLTPGFRTVVTGSGSVLIIPEGCGGANRIMMEQPIDIPVDNNSNETETITTDNTKLKNDNVNASIYPNPIQDKINISLPYAEIDEKIKIEIFDLNGRVIFSEYKTANKNNIQCDINFIDSGMYFINVTGKNVNYNQKIIKE